MDGWIRPNEPRTVGPHLKRWKENHLMAVQLDGKERLTVGTHSRGPPGN